MTDILVAPFSNSHIRDWPIAHYRDLVGLILDHWHGDGRIRITGTAGQKLAACEIVRPYDPARVVNECGRLTWPEVMRSIRHASCVIGNNSGVAHLSGFYGTPTVCVFGGSHQRLEWRPLGRNVVVVSRVIGCSPCQLDHGHASPYAKACLRQIEPRVVAGAVFDLIDRVSAERELGRAGSAAGVSTHAMMQDEGAA